MQKKSLKIKLVAYTPNPLDVVYLACRQCYSADGVEEIISGSVDSAKKEALVKKVFDSGHQSPLEHISFTFAIEGISRACSHQLVRHRLASYSQQSQRYVELGNLPFIMPASIEKNAQAREIFIDIISQIEKAYRELVDLLSEQDKDSRKKVIEDARYILPNACETRIIVTMNARELIHFFEVRCCSRAQWEIRSVANQMLQLVRQVFPVIFSKVGPKCERLGYCPEGTFSCGKYPTKEQVL